MTLSKKKIIMILLIGLVSIGLIAVALILGLRLLGESGSPSQDQVVDPITLRREEANDIKEAADQAYAEGNSEEARKLYEEALTEHKKVDVESGQYTEEGAVSNDTSDVQLQLDILTNEVQPEEAPEIPIPASR